MGGQAGSSSSEGAVAGAGGSGGGDGPSELPPPLPQCAGPLDRTVATRFYDAARCLFEGDDPPQAGVEPNSIDPERVAIVRGRVLDEAGAPLEDVSVRVVDHEELGETRSRADGYFDLAVNGGGWIRVIYEKEGFLRAQRRVRSEWRAFSSFRDVVLVPEAADASEVVLQADMPSLVESAVTTDADGSRHELLIAPAGTRATLVMDDGVREDLHSFHVRIAEYTVGERGPERMPAELPPSSAYTYAVEYSVDEAREQGAASVEFAPPLLSYVENFLNFPAGTVVPRGAYDAKLDTWRAEESGLTITIVHIARGRAEIDADGDDLPEDADTLLALGITDDELGILAERYDVGQSLFRVPVPHFSAWDSNWPFGPPDGAIDPDSEANADGDSSGCQAEVAGSIIGCEGQTLGEVIPISGTPHQLHYQSERARGRAEAYHATIVLSRDNVPETLKQIVLELEILGQKFTRTYEPEANLVDTFVWDGKDAYGRVWQGRQTLEARVGYVYDGAYQAAARFGYNGNGTPITGDRSRSQVTLWSAHRVLLGGMDAQPLDMGGWTFEEHHFYDAPTRTLHLGDGRTRYGESFSDVITTIAGTDASGNQGDGGPALEATLDSPHGLVIAPDGTAYYADDGAQRVRKITPDGTIHLVAGTTSGFSGDGGPATSAQLNGPMGLALASDGTLFVADHDNGRVRAISPDGVITTVAGAGTGDTLEQDVPALEVRMNPHALALGPDGSLYIADDDAQKVRRLGSDGRISTFAGKGGNGASGDGGPALLAEIGHPLGLVLNDLGELFMTDWENGRVRKVDANGIISTVAGGGELAITDGALATEVELWNTHAVDLARDGTLYLTDEGSGLVAKVAPDGKIYKVAGGGPGYADNVPPLEMRFRLPRIVFVHTDGSLWIADYSDSRIRRVRPALPGFSRGEVVIAASNGESAYVFDEYGRHLRTVDTLTRATRWSFDYDDTGRLRALTDGHGNSTQIERNAQGEPIAIHGADAEVTRVSLDDDGYLASVTNANDETSAFTYTDGLLASLRRPGASKAKRYEYDALGRLKLDQHPSGRALSLERTDGQGTSYAVAVTTKLGRTQTVSVDDPSNRELARTRTFSDGTQTSFTRTGSITKLTTPVETATFTVSPDSRFGMQAPFVSSERRVTSRGALEITRARALVLGDPADPLDVKTFEETTTVNDRVWTRRWDGEARTLAVSSPLGRRVVFTHDEHGKIVREAPAGLAPIEYQYDERGRIQLVAQGVSNVRLGYGDDGHAAWIEDALEQRTLFDRDAVGRALLMTGSDGQTLGVTYGAEGWLESLTPPGRSAHAFEYDFDGLLTSYTPPPIDGTDTTRMKYDHDEDAALTAVHFPSGDRLALTYDRSSGQLLEAKMPEETLRFSYDAQGLLSTVSTPTQSVEYSYSAGQLAGQYWTGAVRARTGRHYNALGQLVRETSSAGSVDYTYDDDGLLVSAGDAKLTRDASHGLLTRLEVGSVVTDYSYDEQARLVSFATSVGSEPLYAVDLERDGLGRIVERSETAQGVQRTEAYGYDGAGRLVEVTRDGRTFANYAYDENGNRTRVQQAGVDVTATYDGQDRLVRQGDVQFTYDANGALVARREGRLATTFQYGLLGGLRRVTFGDGRVLDFALDGARRRMNEQVDGTLTREYVYRDMLALSAELAPNGQSAQFVYGTASHVPDYMERGTKSYRLVSDERGSVRFVVDVTSGEVLQALDYDAWGVVTLDTNPRFQPFGFAGGLYEPNTGLVRFGARDYDARSGRWTQKDPSRFADGTNLYSYAGNDPVNRIDPTGYFGVAGVVTGGAIGGALGGVSTWAGGGTAGQIAAATAAGAIGGAIGSGLSGNLSAAVGAGFGAAGNAVSGGNVGSIIGGAIGGAFGGWVSGLPGAGLGGMAAGTMVGGVGAWSLGVAGQGLWDGLGDEGCPR